jgi:predicted metalloprotease with PDZ domain
MSGSALVFAQSGDSGNALRYTLSLADARQHLLHVKLHIPAGAAEHDLQLPVWNALYQIRDFAQYVNWIRARDGAGNPVAVNAINPSRWHIAHCERGCEVEYEIFADDPGPFGAQWNEQHAFFNFAEILLYPVDGRETPIQLRFEGVPRGWKIATALNGSADKEFSADNYDRLVDAPVEIGTFHEADFDYAGGHYRVVVDADPEDYNLDKIAGIDRSIVAAEASWMDDPPSGTYVFIYHFPRGPAGGGMEHANSTAIDVSAKRLEDPASLTGVTAHEFFHRWNVKRIRPQSLEPIDYTKENYTTALWFSEGFTSTAGEIATLRAGLKSADVFLKDIAGQIQQLESRPAHRTQSAEESSLDAWLERYDHYFQPTRSISYYNKGDLLGVALDLQLRQTTGCQVSLRELFRWMNQHYAKQGRFFPDSQGVREAGQAVGRSDLDAFFEKYVSGTEEVPWNDFFRVVGFELKQVTVSVADLGFVLGRRIGDSAAVSQVTPNGEADRAGLTTGDAILTIDGQPTSSNLRQTLEQLKPGDTLKLHVRGPKGERDLHWNLGKRDQIEYELRDSDTVTDAEKACRSAWFRGEPLASAETAR